MNILLPQLSVQPIPELNWSLDRIVMDIGYAPAHEPCRPPHVIRLDLGEPSTIIETISHFPLASVEAPSTKLQHLDLSEALVSQLETRDSSRSASADMIERFGAVIGAEARGRVSNVQGHSQLIVEASSLIAMFGCTFAEK